LKTRFEKDFHAMRVLAFRFLFVRLPFHHAAAQYVDLTAEIEIYDWSARPAWSNTIHLGFGTNTWQMQGAFFMNSQVTYWFTGTNIIEHSIITKELDPEFLKKTSVPGGLAGTAPPVGSQSSRVVESLDGNPGRPVRVSDQLTLPGRIAWLAFCSGPCLQRAGHQLYPPNDLWKELIRAPDGFTNRVTRFEDALGLPHTVDLYTDTSQPVLQYRVTASTNILEWTIPLEFYAAQYRPAYIPGAHRFNTNAWELDFTARGKVTAIAVGAQLQIPPVQK
jgi:hypothetical protein